MSILLSLDFFSDDFKHGILEVPDHVEKYDEPRRRRYICDAISSVHTPHSWMLPRTHEGEITIITCKIVGRLRRNVDQARLIRGLES